MTKAHIAWITRATIVLAAVATPILATSVISVRMRINARSFIIGDNPAYTPDHKFIAETMDYYIPCISLIAIFMFLGTICLVRALAGYFASGIAYLWHFDSVEYRIAAKGKLRDDRHAYAVAAGILLVIAAAGAVIFVVVLIDPDLI